MIEEFLERLARTEEKHPKTVIAIFLLITVGFMAGFPLITTEASFENFIPEDTPVIQGITTIRDKLGTGTSTIILIASLDSEDPGAATSITDREVLEAVDELIRLVEVNEFVVFTESVLPLVEGKEQFEIDSLLEDHDLISSDKRIMLIRFIIPDSLSLEQAQEVVNEARHQIEHAPKPFGLSYRLSGQIVQDQEITETFGSSIGFVTMLGFVGVFIVLFLIFRSPSHVLVSVIPIIFGTIWTNGTLGFIGIPFSTALTGVFSMIIGIGIDFAIHIVHRFDEEIKRTNLQNAIVRAVRNVGKGLTFTTITTVIGFLALLSATLPVLHDMAIALSFGVVYSLIAAIGIIPPVLVLFERRNQKKR